VPQTTAPPRTPVTLRAAIFARNRPCAVIDMCLVIGENVTLFSRPKA
jgi:hypothetical protein